MSSVTLKWTPPITRSDGTPLPSASIASANVFDSASPTPSTAIGSVLGVVGTFTTGTLGDGVHNFTVVTVDTDGNASAPSNVASATIAEAAPSAITDLTATVNS